MGGFKNLMMRDLGKLSQKQLQTKLVNTKEPASMIAKRKQLIKILDAEYGLANLEDLINKLDHLGSSRKAKLLKLLQKYKNVLDGTLGDFKILPVRLE